MNLSNLTDTEIVGLTIYGEGRGEPISGQIAIGSVIRNRVTKVKTYFDVCFAPFQFSCWDEHDPNYSILVELAEKLVMGEYSTDSTLNQCLWIAKGIVDNLIIDNTHGANHYLTKALMSSNPPTWAKQMNNVVTIGNQVYGTVA